jgi:hypothetical protein
LLSADVAGNQALLLAVLAENGRAFLGVVEHVVLEELAPGAVQARDFGDNHATLEAGEWQIG